MIDTRAHRDALKKAAEYVARFIRAAAPGESGATFKIYRRGESYYVGSRAWSAVMTETNKRHMLFGDRNGPWWNENVHHPERTSWMEKATELAVDRAADEAADEWLRGVTAHSSYLESHR